MKPRKSAHNPQRELFRVELSMLVDAEHPLVKLGGKIDWTRFEEGRIRDRLNTIEMQSRFRLPDSHFDSTSPSPLRPCALLALKFRRLSAIRSTTS
jgi:hypothetical protein